MSEILIDHVLLDRVTKDAKESPRLRMNYNFHESLSSPSQRLLNALEPGTVLPIHRHRHTAETYVLLRGRMRVLFYDDDKKEINRYELDPAEGTYGVNIPRGQWHTIEVLCAGTVIFDRYPGSADCHMHRPRWGSRHCAGSALASNRS